MDLLFLFMMEFNSHLSFEVFHYISFKKLHSHINLLRKLHFRVNGVDKIWRLMITALISASFGNEFIILIY
jgi:hypothetical protein